MCFTRQTLYFSFILPDSTQMSGTMKSRDGKTIWTTTAPTQTRTGAENIIRNQTGITADGRVDTIGQTFELFITNDMISSIVKYTNKEAHRVVNEWNQSHVKQHVWKDTDEVEMKAVLGLLILSGAYRSNTESLEELWSLETGRPIFVATMCIERFKQILRFMRFDDKDTRAERVQLDRLAPIRDLWDKFNANLQKPYIPSPYITVDEQLALFRGRCPFIVYIPSKPGKYGVKIWWACDSVTTYPLHGQVYLGRQPGQPREVGQGRRVVHDLVKPWYRTGRNVTADNLFTSVKLVHELLDQQLTYVGTVRKNKGEIAQEMLPRRDREVLSSVFGFSGSLTMVSYVPKKNKAVVVLSSQHHDSRVEGEKRKPEIISFYNQTKGGVDNMDHLISVSTCKRKTRRWPLMLFYNMIDVATIASFVIWLCNFPNWKPALYNRKRRAFLIKLGYTLVGEYIERRLSAGTRTLGKNATKALITLGYLNSGDRSHKGGEGHRARCYLCPRSSDRKYARSCNKCSAQVCPEHSSATFTCTACL